MTKEITHEGPCKNRTTVGSVKGGRRCRCGCRCRCIFFRGATRREDEAEEGQPGEMVITSCLLTCRGLVSGPWALAERIVSTYADDNYQLSRFVRLGFEGICYSCLPDSIYFRHHTTDCASRKRREDVRHTYRNSSIPASPVLPSPPQ